MGKWLVKSYKLINYPNFSLELPLQLGRIQIGLYILMHTRIVHADRLLHILFIRTGKQASAITPTVQSTA